MYSAPSLSGGTVADPFAFMRDHGLPGMDIQGSIAMLHAQHAA